MLVVAAAVAVGVLAARSEPIVPAGHHSHATCTAADPACRERHYAQLARESGVPAALAALAGEGDDVRTSCHRLTHVIGQVAAERHPRIPDAFDQGRHLCGMGYYHGVVQAVVAGMGRGAALAGIDTLCADLGQHGRRSAYHLGCAHGLGHGLMAVLDGRLFDALAACDLLTDPWEQGHCQNGVFMENLHSAHHTEGTAAYLRPDEPLYPCTVVADRHRDQCLEKQTSYAVAVTDGDFGRVFAMCAEVDALFRTACHRGLGRNAFEAATRSDVGDPVAVARQRCETGSDPGARASCLAWAARYFVLFDGDDGRATTLCAGLAPQARPACAAAAWDATGLFLE